MNKKRKFLVTGGAGFIGSYMVEALLQRDCEVIAIDNLSTGRIENIEAFENNENFKFVFDDVTNERLMNTLAKDSDVIIHLAASVGVQKILQDPVAMMENNLLTTKIILECARINKCKVFFASSSEVYGKLHKESLNEEDTFVLGNPKQMRWSYAASKLLGEFLALGYANQYGVEVVMARFFNTVGPRQSGAYGMVIPRFISQALSDKPMVIYEDGKQTRCFCDVRDTVSAVLTLIDTPAAYNNVFNIGGTEEISILELGKYIKDKTGSKSEFEFIPYKSLAANFDEVRKRKPDVSKIKSLIGWTQKYSLEQTISEIIEYNKVNCKV